MPRGAETAGDQLPRRGRAGFVAGDFDHGLHFARQASDGLRRQGRVALLTQALVLQTFAALYLGRWETTHVAAEEAYRFAVETRQPVWAACAQLGRANLAGLRGEYDRAWSLSGEVEGYALGTGNRSLLNGVRLSRGFAALGDDRPAVAFAEFRRMMDPADQSYQAPQFAFAVDYLADAAVLSVKRSRRRRSSVTSRSWPTAPPHPACCGPWRWPAPCWPAPRWPTMAAPSGVSRRPGNTPPTLPCGTGRALT
jgi:hypothetical protein